MLHIGLFRCHPWKKSSWFQHMSTSLFQPAGSDNNEPTITNNKTTIQPFTLPGRVLGGCSSNSNRDSDNIIRTDLNQGNIISAATATRQRMVDTRTARLLAFDKQHQQQHKKMLTSNVGDENV
jgi:hypothetical protein